MFELCEPVGRGFVGIPWVKSEAGADNGVLLAEGEHFFPVTFMGAVDDHGGDSVFGGSLNCVSGIFMQAAVLQMVMAVE